MQAGYELLALVLGVVVANEFIRFGFKQMIGTRYDRLNGIKKDIDEIKKDVHDIKKIMLKWSMEGKMNPSDMHDVL